MSIAYPLGIYLTRLGDTPQSALPALLKYNVSQQPPPMVQLSLAFNSFSFQAIVPSASVTDLPFARL